MKREPLPAVILAAGKGSRLGKLTQSRSKAMLPVLEKPVIQRVMNPLIANGVRDFVIVIQPGDQEIQDYFQHQTDLEIRIHFTTQDPPEGMAKALASAAPFIQGDFLLSACDNIVSGDQIGKLLDCWLAHPNLAGLLSILTVEEGQLIRSGVVEMQGPWVRRIIEKPSLDRAPSNLASLPLYIFSNDILGYLPSLQPSSRGEYELQDAIQRLVDNHDQVMGLPLNHRLTLTRPDDLLAINRHFLAEDPELMATNIETFTGLEVTSPVMIEPGVEMGAGCRIGPYVYLEKGAKIGSQAHISNAVVLREASIEPSAVICDRVIG
jgi:glucose-1-phosphate thymidylyltransferase